ncbi:hypothetical protein KBY58_11345 [Cyanobium sp. HWJ4-Hawea]|uniref:hypothetical protein n=1 Tax=Cyanobium sp. HWJ4-Hawea TaxID=2823713 RepID=UPI0020CEB409|nr:hypothetical protein [Cyanobium sp. HWJ4-Hawea]MCP9810029.1 hypothetical protein [Cyanobium sp. HWJ4-Hawea]
MGSTTTYDKHWHFGVGEGQAFLVSDAAGDFHSQCSSLFMTLVFAFDRQRLADRAASIAKNRQDPAAFLRNCPTKLVVGEDRSSQILLAQIRRLVLLIDQASESESSSVQLRALGSSLEKTMALLAFPELLSP